MNMINKEQLLYFFLNGKVSLSQYDYKFMANLQTIIQNHSRVTTNQADLFDKLISKYNKQLVKNGLVKEELKSLPWKTMLVESTPEYTGASVRLVGDEIVIRVPFNKSFISNFRHIENNTFTWDGNEKVYRTKFSTLALKVAHTILPKYFSCVRYCDKLEPIINELSRYEKFIWNPTAIKIDNKLLIAASNEVLASKISEKDLEITPKNIFNIARMGITIHPEVYHNDEELSFASNPSYLVDYSDLEKTIAWMKNVGCENVIVGRGLRAVSWRERLTNIIEKYGMKVLGPSNFGIIPAGISMLIQHVSTVDSRQMFVGSISKTIVIQDSRPIEVL